MRHFLASLLMLVMLTPGLACGAMLCAKKAQAAQEMPCHDEKQKDNADEATMLFKDCSGVDLAQAGHGKTVQKPDIQIEKVFYALADLTAGGNLAPAPVYQIRGPPVTTANAQTYPPLYLTTQRLRL